MNKFFRYAGIVASVALIITGVAAMALGAAGRNTVRDNLAAEKIVGTPDMTPAAIKAEAKAAGLTNVDLPSCSVAGKAVDNGKDARCFAQYMRVHTLEATGGQVYAEMGRYLDRSGKPTNDEQTAATDPKTKKPVENGARNIWVNETALSTALNTSFFAENVALFSVVVGFMLLLSGIGFLVLTVNLLRPQTAPQRTAAPAPTGSPVITG